MQKEENESENDSAPLDKQGAPTSQIDKQAIADGWRQVRDKVKEITGKRPDTKAILFIVGLRELGRSFGAVLEKGDKQDVMHVGLSSAMEKCGYLSKTFVDDDGWPHWEQVKPFPKMDMEQQEYQIRDLLVQYFRIEKLIPS